MVKATEFVNVKWPSDTVCRATTYEKFPIVKSMSVEFSAYVFLVKKKANSYKKQNHPL